MIKIAVDCFGGDNSPKANVEGAVAALGRRPQLEVVLTGDAGKIEAELSRLEYDKTRVSVVDAPDVIGCDEKPTEAIKQKKDSSMVRAIELSRSDESVRGMVTTGSTGAALVGAVLRVGRLRGVARPAFCPILPTMTGGIVGISDSGANIDCTPEYLHQFAVMGSLYLESIFGVSSPRVALLNVGEEENKGDDLRKEAYAILKADEGINFVGNMESRELLSGKIDLVICDGFSGNVLIKATEGACLEILKKLKREISGSLRNKIGALFMKKMLMQNKAFMDYQNYGGSVMLGTKKVVVKGHGSSKAKGVRKCVELACDMAERDLCGDIEKALVARKTKEAPASV